MSVRGPFRGEFQKHKNIMKRDDRVTHSVEPHKSGMTTQLRPQSTAPLASLGNARILG